MIAFINNKAIGLVADGLYALLTLQIILWNSAHERKQSIHGLSVDNMNTSFLFDEQ